MEPYFKPVVVDNDEDTKVKNDVAPANTYTNNTNSLDKRGPIMHQAEALAIKWKGKTQNAWKRTINIYNIKGLVSWIVVLKRNRKRKYITLQSF